MNSITRRWWLLALCYTTILLTGCFPEDGLEWSADGSAGLLRVDGTLFLVDGQSGQLTPLQTDGEVGLMPDISADGKQIAYVRGRVYGTVEEGMREFPEATVQTIKRHAEQFAQRVLAGAVKVADLPRGRSGPFDDGETFDPWVVRVMCEAPSPELATRIGQKKLQECRECELGANQLIVANRQEPHQIKVITTMPVAVYRPRFSPDGRQVAYIMATLEGQEKVALAVASLEGGIGPVLVREPIALGYDWRPDGKALAYAKQDGDEILAVIEEIVIVDEKGALLAREIDITQGTSFYGMMSEGRTKQFAGTLFQPTMRVQYGPDGRVFFSSVAAQIPTSELDEPEYSLFCYDRVIGTVTRILPGIFGEQASQTMSFFSVSPDGTRLLVPLRSNRFAIYELGTNDGVFPLEEDEGYGEDELPEFLPQWKGSDRITCLVPATSHFLVGQDGQPHGRKEIVVLDLEGKLVKVLSEGWPDEAIPSTGN